jgi:hypothetical protein
MRFLFSGFALLSLLQLHAQRKSYVLDVAAGPVYNQEIFRTASLRIPPRSSAAIGAQAIFKFKAEENANAELHLVPAFWKQYFYYKSPIGYFGIHSNSLALQSEILLNSETRKVNPVLGIGIVHTSFSQINWVIDGKKYDKDNLPENVMNRVKGYDRVWHPMISLGASYIVKAGIRQLDIYPKIMYSLKEYMLDPAVVYPYEIVNMPSLAQNIQTRPIYFGISVNYYYSRIKNWTIYK